MTDHPTVNPSEAPGHMTDHRTPVHGHRGCRGVLPENTVVGFLRALDDGADVLEMDVVCTADHRILVSHEPYMHHEICALPSGERIGPEAETELNIYRMTLDDVRTFPCGTFTHPRFPDQLQCESRKPALREVLDAVSGYCADRDRELPGFNIEIKSLPEWDGAYHPLPEPYTDLFLREIGEWPAGIFLTIQSFDLRILRAIRRKAPDQRLVLLADDSVADHDGLIESLGFSPYAYSPHFSRIDAPLVKDFRNKGMRLIAWTVNGEEDIRRMLQLGVDGLITDYPSRAVALRNAILP
jgi:glycerophosphoryl diester phosphodiesterase